MRGRWNLSGFRGRKSRWSGSGQRWKTLRVSQTVNSVLKKTACGGAESQKRSLIRNTMVHTVDGGGEQSYEPGQLESLPGDCLVQYIGNRLAMIQIDYPWDLPAPPLALNFYE